MFSHRASIVFGLIFSAGLSLGLVAPEARGQSTAIPSSAIYQVTISGTASGWSFSRVGYLFITPTYDPFNASNNGVNVRDFALLSGNPMTNPQRGSIQFGTNTGMLGAPSRLDVAYVTVNQSAGTVRISTAPNISFGSSFELFNVSSGFTADVYSITSGTLNLNFSNRWNNVTGAAQFSGRGFLYGNASYSASISGFRIQ